MYSGAYSVYTMSVPIAHPAPNAHSIVVANKGIYSHSSSKILSKFIVICSKLYTCTAGPQYTMCMYNMLARLEYSHAVIVIHNSLAWAYVS